MPGPRNPWLTPYMIDWSRSVHDCAHRRVVAVTAAQSGKTDSMLDVIGARLDQRPAPIIYVGPTREFLTDQFEPRLMGLLDEAETLKNKVVRGRNMKKTLKWVAGVRLRLAHASSSTALKSDPAALALIDEYDEMVKSINGQGDVLGLVEARGETYSDFTTAVTSTPSKGVVHTKIDKVSGLEFWERADDASLLESPIWSLWQEGTRHHWTWPCKACNQYFVPRFKTLQWPTGASPSEAKRQAVVVCPNCGGTHTEDDKAWLNERGAMVAPGQSVELVDDKPVVTGEAAESSTISFWTSGLCSPFVTFGQRAETYLTAVNSGDRNRIQTAINAGFGELFAPSGGDVLDTMEVAACKLPYRNGEVPEGIRVLTAGVDVQKNRLVYAVRGWGAQGTSWLVDHGELWGHTADPEVWDRLDDLLETPFAGLKIRLAMIDSGFRPMKADRGPEHIVYEFCRRHQRNTRPSKGVDTLAAGALVISHIEVTADGARAKYGLDLVRINTDWCKLWVHERIRWPKDQPGAFFLPDDVTEAYQFQIVSEARLRTAGGKVQWVAKSRENHFLDCEAMAYAAGHLLSVQRIPGELPRQAAKAIVEEIEEIPLKKQTTNPTPRPTNPRGGRSSYLNR